MYNIKTAKYDGYIYCIENVTTGMRYIGQTSVTILSRWASHVSCSKSGKERHLHLHRAIYKYGVQAFNVTEVECISSASPEELKALLNLRERHFISLFNTLHPAGYNMNDGGDSTIASIKRGVYKVDKSGSILSHYPSIRAAGIENCILPSLINKACRGNNHFSHDFYWFYDNEFSGDPSYIEIPKQIKCGNKIGKKIGGKVVLQYAQNGEYIKTFPSAKDASLSVGLSEDKVASCCRRNGKVQRLKYTSGGYRWMYAAVFNAKNQK